MARSKRPSQRLSKQELQKAIANESKKFEENYSWIDQHMPASFFEEVDQESIWLIVHSLENFNLNDYFSHLHLKNVGYAMCLDSPDADLRILKQYKRYGIKNYRSFVSNEPPPFPGIKAPLRIARLLFSEYVETPEADLLPAEKEKEILGEIQARNPQVNARDLHRLVEQLSPMFVKAMTKERLVMALDMFFRAKSRDNCQYEVRYNEDWKKKKDAPSLQIVFAWRNVPKYNFLYRLAKVIHRHGLALKRVNAALYRSLQHAKHFADVFRDSWKQRRSCLGRSGYA